MLFKIRLDLEHSKGISNFFLHMAFVFGHILLIHVVYFAHFSPEIRKCVRTNSYVRNVWYNITNQLGVGTNSTGKQYKHYIHCEAQQNLKQKQEKCNNVVCMQHTTNTGDGIFMKKKTPRFMYETLETFPVTITLDINIPVPHHLYPVCLLCELNINKV